MRKGKQIWCRRPVGEEEAGAEAAEAEKEGPFPRHRTRPVGPPIATPSALQRHRTPQNLTPTTSSSAPSKPTTHIGDSTRRSSLRRRRLGMGAGGGRNYKLTLYFFGNCYELPRLFIMRPMKFSYLWKQDCGCEYLLLMDIGWAVVGSFLARTGTVKLRVVGCVLVLGT